MAAERRRRIEDTEELRWNQLKLLLEWPEQVEYEKIRDAVVFGHAVLECAEKTGTPESTLNRRVASFHAYGIRGLIPLEPDGG